MTISTAVLAVTTIVLTVATWKYASLTRRLVELAQGERILTMLAIQEAKRSHLESDYTLVCAADAARAAAGDSENSPARAPLRKRMELLYKTIDQVAREITSLREELRESEARR